MLNGSIIAKLEADLVAARLRADAAFARAEQMQAERDALARKAAERASQTCFFGNPWAQPDFWLDEAAQEVAKRRAGYRIKIKKGNDIDV